MGRCATRCQLTTRREQVSRHVAPAPTDQRQVSDIPDPHLIRGSGRKLIKQQVFGYDGRRVGYRGARALRPGAQRAKAPAPQLGAQGIASDGIPFGA